jgi:hypothetical protein
MGKDVVVAHADEGELTEVGVGSEILTAVSLERDMTLTECGGSCQEA